MKTEHSESTTTQPEITEERESLLNPSHHTQPPTQESEWITFPEAPELKYNRRPYKGIFLALFLMFAGLLFFSHGFHRYEEYTMWDLLAVWVLSTLLIIPGMFYAFIFVMVELGAKGFSYKNHPELEF